MAKLPVKNTILDGELVCLDNDGRSIFLDLRRRRRDACFYAFDLLWLDGKDLRGLTFFRRQRPQPNNPPNGRYLIGGLGRSCSLKRRQPDQKPQRGTTIQARVPLSPRMKSAEAHG